MNKQIRWLCESAVMIAAAVVLSMVAIVKMPFGGSITACSMVPIVLIAYRYGMARGFAVGFVYSLIQLLLDTGIFSYATGAVAVVVILFCDYLLAFTALGLGGAFKKTGLSQPAAISLGALLACALRYVMHCISGYAVWSDITKSVGQRIAYSVTYNSAYMIPETIITVAGVWYIAKNIDLNGEKLTRRVVSGQSSAESVFSALSLLFGLLTATYAVLRLFSFMQTEEGFSIDALVKANYCGFITVVASGAAVTLICVLIKFIIKKKKQA